MERVHGRKQVDDNNSVSFARHRMATAIICICRADAFSEATNAQYRSAGSRNHFPFFLFLMKNTGTGHHRSTLSLSCVRVGCLRRYMIVSSLNALSKSDVLRRSTRATTNDHQPKGIYNPLGAFSTILFLFRPKFLDSKKTTTKRKEYKKRNTAT